MKDSQQGYASVFGNVKYIKANNERFSTTDGHNEVAH